jgi:hypothetical protein
VKRRRRLRRLVPDAELIRRRAAGETLRELACDYRVARTTLGRYFVRPEVKRQLKQAAIQLRSEQRQLRARHAAERRLEQEVRQRADEQIAAEREQERRYRKDFAEWLRRRPGGGDAALLHERDAPWLQLARDRHSTYDKEAEQAVAAGGGTRALLAATELPTDETAAGTIDPVILARAFDNDARERAQPWPLTSKRGPRLPDSSPTRSSFAAAPPASRCGRSPATTTSPTAPSPASSPARRSKNSSAKPGSSSAPNDGRSRPAAPPRGDSNRKPAASRPPNRSSRAGPTPPDRPTERTPPAASAATRLSSFHHKATSARLHERTE